MGSTSGISGIQKEEKIPTPTIMSCERCLDDISHIYEDVMGDVVFGEVCLEAGRADADPTLCVWLRPDVSSKWNHMTRLKSDQSPYLSHSSTDPRDADLQSI